MCRAPAPPPVVNFRRLPVKCLCVNFLLLFCDFFPGFKEEDGCISHGSMRHNMHDYHIHLCNLCRLCSSPPSGHTDHVWLVSHFQLFSHFFDRPLPPPVCSAVWPPPGLLLPAKNHSSRLEKNWRNEMCGTVWSVFLLVNLKKCDLSLTVGPWKRGVWDSGFKFQTGTGFRIQISNRAGFRIQISVCQYVVLSKFVYCILGTILGYVGFLKSVYWYIRPPATGP